MSDIPETPEGFDPERLRESFMEVWKEPWFVGFAAGVLGYTLSALAWDYYNRHGTVRCVHCGKRGADLSLETGMWHAKCWWSTQGDGLPGWLTQVPVTDGATPPRRTSGVGATPQDADHPRPGPQPPVEHLREPQVLPPKAAPEAQRQVSRQGHPQPGPAPLRAAPQRPPQAPEGSPPQGSPPQEPPQGSPPQG